MLNINVVPLWNKRSNIMEKELRIRVSKQLKEKIEQKAKELNISVSAYVRMKLSE